MAAGSLWALSSLLGRWERHNYKFGGVTNPMSETDETAEKHFLDHPEVNELFDSAISSVVGESDRGAVLVAAAYVDMHLRRLFEQLAPDDMSRKRLKEILDYPGTLSSLASRADVAYVTRLIGKSLYEAIGHLRRIRNAVAHRPDSFRLEDHKDRVRKVLDLGPNVPVGINRFALDLLMRSAIDTLMTLEMPTGEPGRPMFQAPGEVVDYLIKNRHHLEPLNARLLHWELAVGAVFICALIIHERDAATKLLGPRDRLVRLCTGDGGEGSPTEST